jgi:hypothetical protein
MKSSLSTLWKKKTKERPRPCNQAPSPAEAGNGKGRGEAKGVGRRAVQFNDWSYSDYRLRNSVIASLSARAWSGSAQVECMCPEPWIDRIIDWSRLQLNRSSKQQ